MTSYVVPTRVTDSARAGQPGSAVNIPIIYYSRGSEIVEEADKKAVAVRGTLSVRGTSFDTIERAGGYVYLRQAEISYVCHMEESQNPKFNKRQQIRPAHTFHNSQGRLANILIHPGNLPHHFVGCIGVGNRSTRGLEGSREAMKQLLLLLGGFKPGTEVWLQVSGDMPAP